MATLERSAKLVRSKSRALGPSLASLYGACYTRPMLILLFALLASPVSEAKKIATPMVSQVSRTRFEVSRKALERDVKDPMKELGTFSVVPTLSLSGITINGFTPQCRLPLFGFRSGDVVEMVNGQPIRTPLDLIEIGENLAKIRTGAKVRVNLRRGEQDLVHTYLLVE